MFEKRSKGWIEVIVGNMYAGKTEELIRRIRRIGFAKQKVLVFKPKLDNRYHPTHVVSHAGDEVDAIAIEDATEILGYLDKLEDVEAIAIDEVQFFKQTTIDVLDYLANQGIRVIAAGLDKDFRGEPFGLMPNLLTQAEEVTKLTAICSVCGEPASRTQRLVNGEPADYNDPIVQIGAQECYEPRCRHCHIVKNKPKLPF